MEAYKALLEALLEDMDEIVDYYDNHTSDNKKVSQMVEDIRDTLDLYRDGPTDDDLVVSDEEYDIEVKAEVWANLE